MTSGKSVNIRRGAFGTWFATRGEKPLGGGVLEATTKFEVENGPELEKMWDALGWLSALEKATGKTREQIADDYDLVIAERGTEAPALSDVPSKNEGPGHA